jgi:hypothetical protein
MHVHQRAEGQGSSSSVVRGREDHGGRVGRAGKFNSWLIFHLGSDLDIVDADELVVGLDETATVCTAIGHNRCNVHPRVALLLTDNRDSGLILFGKVHGPRSRFSAPMSWTRIWNFFRVKGYKSRPPAPSNDPSGVGPVGIPGTCESHSLLISKGGRVSM